MTILVFLFLVFSSTVVLAEPTNKIIQLEYHEPTTSAARTGSQIKAGFSDKCFTFIGQINATQEPCVSHPNQLYTLNQIRPGIFHLQILKNLQCVQVIGGSPANSTEFELADCDIGNIHQQWHIGTGLGKIRVNNGEPLPGQCLNVSGGVTSIGDGNPIRQWTCTPGAENDEFLVELKEGVESPLNDLAGTRIYWDLIHDGNTETMIPIPASAFTGGGLIERSLNIPIPDDQGTYEFKLEATAYDTAGNESLRTAPVTKAIVPIDTKAPATPTGLEIIEEQG